MDSEEFSSSSSELELSQKCVSIPSSSPSTSQLPLISTFSLSEILKHLQDVAPKQQKKQFISVTSKTTYAVSCDVVTKSEASAVDICEASPNIGGAFSNSETRCWPSMKPSFKLQCFRCVQRNHVQLKSTLTDDRRSRCLSCCEPGFQELRTSDTSQCSLYEELDKSKEHSQTKQNFADSDNAVKTAASQKTVMGTLLAETDVENKLCLQLQLQANVNDYCIQDRLIGSVSQKKTVVLTEPYSIKPPPAVIDDNILMNIRNQPRALHIPNRRPTLPMHWNLAWINEAYENYLMKACDGRLKLQNRNDTTGTLQDTQALISDSSVPRTRQNAHWWTEEIAELRKACIKARRQYTRSRKRRGDPATLQILWEELREVYKTARRAFYSAIREAKKQTQIPSSEEWKGQPHPEQVCPGSSVA